MTQGGGGRECTLFLFRGSNAYEEYMMISCAKCGAQIEGETTCPRCGEKLSPDRAARGLAIASDIIGAACGLSAGIQLVIDYAQNGRFGWSLIGLASCAVAWILIGFPLLAFRRPAVFLPIMAFSALAYLWILQVLTGGSWFLPIGLPIGLAVIASSILPVILSIKAKQRGPNIAAFILEGGTIACLAVENVLSLHGQGGCSVTWSGIVAVAALPTAFLLLGIQRRLRPAS